MNTQDRWTALKRIHEQLSNAAPQDRDALLVELADGDASLLEDARSLFDACDRVDALPVPRPQTLDGWFGTSLSDVPPPGRRFGPFRLVREIARGGMGVVFEAEQDEPKRRVALKILRWGIASEVARARFEQEARVLGNLVHPGIAALHEVGTHDTASGERVPYLVMELVRDARPITDFVLSEDLSRDERLSLFLDVAGAVTAGHQRGVIHRDLKPDNVLVDGEGRPRVIDFGIARVTAPDMEREHVTEAGLIVGTLGYIAPEQLRADRAGDDVRMDVYALGVILFEMLTGQPPLDLSGLSAMEAIGATLEKRPTAATDIAPDTPHDLSLILGTALAKDPGARYASVDAFVSDIERFRNNEPIHARKPSWTYQLRLFARRHRLAVAASVVVGASLATATWVSLRSSSVAQEAERQASASALRASELLVSNQELIRRLFEEHYDALVSVPGTLEARLDLVRRLEENALSLRLQADDDERLLRTTGELHMRVAALNFRLGGDHLGRPGPAREALGRAAKVFELLRAREDVSPAARVIDRLQVATIAGHLADLDAFEGETKRGRRAAAEALVSLEEIVRNHPELMIARVRHASQSLRLARMEWRAARREDAIQRVRDGLRTLPDDLPESEEAAADVHGNRALLHALHGEILRGDAQWEDAQAQLDLALRSLDAEAALDPSRPALSAKYAQVYGELGLVLLRKGDAASAEKPLAKAVRLGRAQVARNPEDRRARALLRVDLARMGEVCVAQGDLAAGIRWQKEAVGLAEVLAREQPGVLVAQLDLRIGLRRLGNYYMKQGDLPATVTLAERAHALAERLVGAYTATVPARLGWGEALDALGIARWWASEGKPLAARRALLKKARALFAASRDVYESMQTDGVLPTTHANAPEFARSKIKLCDDALASLEDRANLDDHK